MRDWATAGETNASWMMKGVLDFILSSHPDAEVMQSRRSM